MFHCYILQVFWYNTILLLLKFVFYTIFYKEKLATSSKNKVIKTYRSEWKNFDSLNLELNGLDLDAVYNNFITQISAGKIETNEEISIKDAVEKSVEIEKLQRKIEQLKNKINKEPQFNKQLELKKELKLLQSELENKK